MSMMNVVATTGSTNIAHIVRNKRLHYSQSILPETKCTDESLVQFIIMVGVVVVVQSTVWQWCGLYTRRHKKATTTAATATTTSIIATSKSRILFDIHHHYDL